MSSDRAYTVPTRSPLRSAAAERRIDRDARRTQEDV